MEINLILNLGLHVVTRFMLSPILCDYDRINSQTPPSILTNEAPTLLYPVVCHVSNDQDHTQFILIMMIQSISSCHIRVLLITGSNLATESSQFVLKSRLLILFQQPFLAIYFLIYFSVFIIPSSTSNYGFNYFVVVYYKRHKIPDTGMFCLM